jgi:hypothetical protein
VDGVEEGLKQLMQDLGMSENLQQLIRDLTEAHLDCSELGIEAGTTAITTVKLGVMQSVVGRVIGRQGVALHRVLAATDAWIDVSDDGSFVAAEEISFTGATSVETGHLFTA